MNIKYGVTLITIILSIVILIILSSAAVYIGTEVTEQSRLAVFYNNVTAIQDAVNIQFVKNMEKYAFDSSKNMQQYKWEGILNGYIIENGLPSFNVYSGSYNNHEVYLLSDNLRQIVNTDSIDFANYAIDRNGVVYHKGYSIGNTTYYNRIESGPREYLHSLNIDANLYKGSIIATKTQDIRKNESLTIRVIPNMLYELDKLYVDNIDVTSSVVNNQFVYTMPDYDVVITATFKKIPFTYQDIEIPLAIGTVTYKGLTITIDENSNITLRGSLNSADDSVFFKLTKSNTGVEENITANSTALGLKNSQVIVKAGEKYNFRIETDDFDKIISTNNNGKPESVNICLRSTVGSYGTMVNTINALKPESQNPSDGTYSIDNGNISSIYVFVANKVYFDNFTFKVAINKEMKPNIVINEPVNYFNMKVDEAHWVETQTDTPDLRVEVLPDYSIKISGSNNGKKVYIAFLEDETIMCYDTFTHINDKMMANPELFTDDTEKTVRIIELNDKRKFVGPSTVKQFNFVFRKNGVDGGKPTSITEGMMNIKMASKNVAESGLQADGTYCLTSSASLSLTNANVLAIYITDNYWDFGDGYIVIPILDE